MIPDLPELSPFPELQWELEENGRYSISEEDADRLLDYVENKLNTYRHELQNYREILSILQFALEAEK